MVSCSFHPLDSAACYPFHRGWSANILGVESVVSIVLFSPWFRFFVRWFDRHDQLNQCCTQRVRRQILHFIRVRNHCCANHVEQISKICAQTEPRGSRSQDHSGRPSRSKILGTRCSVIQHLSFAQPGSNPWNEVRLGVLAMPRDGRSHTRINDVCLARWPLDITSMRRSNTLPFVETWNSCTPRSNCVYAPFLRMSCSNKMRGCCGIALHRLRALVAGRAREAQSLQPHGVPTRPACGRQTRLGGKQRPVPRQRHGSA